MSNIIVPGQQPPTYPQTNVQCTPQGIIFMIALGPTITINHLVAHSDMEQIEAMRRAKLREFQEMNEIAERAIKGKL